MCEAPYRYWQKLSTALKVLAECGHSPSDFRREFMNTMNKRLAAYVQEFEQHLKLCSTCAAVASETTFRPYAAMVLTDNAFRALYIHDTHGTWAEKTVVQSFAGKQGRVAGFEAVASRPFEDEIIGIDCWLRCTETGRMYPLQLTTAFGKFTEKATRAIEHGIVPIYLNNNLLMEIGGVEGARKPLVQQIVHQFYSYVAEFGHVFIERSDCEIQEVFSMILNKALQT